MQAILAFSKTKTTMQILYRTKEESNAEQEASFLSLLPEERFYVFLALSEKIKKFPLNSIGNEKNSNFKIVLGSNAK